MDHIYKEFKWEESVTCAHNYILPCLKRVIKSIKLSDNSLILDAGCGGGEIVNILNKKIDFKSIYGFDASLSGIELAKKKFSHLKGHFLNHNAYEKELPKQIAHKYDLIISIEVIEHLYGPNLYFANIYQWLKRGGYLFLTTPYHGYFKNLVMAFFNRLDKHYAPNVEGGHIKFFSKNTLVKMLASSGFEIVDNYGVGRFPYLWKSMVLVAIKI